MAGEVSTAEATTYPRGFARNTKWKWPLVPARQLVALNYGRALKADARLPGEVPVFGTNDQCGWHDAPLARAPGLILGRKGQGPLGVEWCDRDFWVIDTAYYASTIKPDVDLKYLYHLIKYIGLNHLKDGTSNPTLSQDSFGSQLLPLPPLNEQKRIAHILGTLDDKIELNRRMNSTLEAMARALFQSWFVDFDPVRAKMGGRKPEGVDDATAALFPAAYQETKVGNVPAGWRLGSFSDLCNLKRGHDLPTSTRTAGDIPVISSSGTSGTHSETNVRGPGVVTGRYGTIGKVFYIEGDFWPLNTTLYIDDFKGSPPRFIYHALGEMNFAKYIDKAAVPGVNRNHLHEEPTVIPSMDVRHAFARAVTPLWLKHGDNDCQSRTLTALRDSLLPKLMCGGLIAYSTL